MNENKVKVTLFTHKHPQHLSLGRSFLKTLGGDREGADICDEYENMFRELRLKFGERVSSRKIFVDKVKGVREKYELDIIPTLVVTEFEDTSPEETKRRALSDRRFSGRVSNDEIFTYIEDIISDK